MLEHKNGTTRRHPDLRGRDGMLAKQCRHFWRQDCEILPPGGSYQPRMAVIVHRDPVERNTGDASSIIEHPPRSRGSFGDSSRPLAHRLLALSAGSWRDSVRDEMAKMRFRLQESAGQRALEASGERGANSNPGFRGPRAIDVNEKAAIRHCLHPCASAA
jgi:hypothetical protein